MNHLKLKEGTILENHMVNYDNLDITKSYSEKLEYLDEVINAIKID